MPELSLNSGSQGLSDWIDTNADGLGDGWSTTLNTTYPSIASIVTGNGFSSRAQRIVENNSSNLAYVAHGGIGFFVGKTYQISGKYRCLGGIRIFLTSQGVVKTLIDNTSNAISFDVTLTCTVQSYLMFLSTTGTEGNWFEIDEISVKEVTESDTVNFNKCLNSGFGLATDFVDTNGDGLANYFVGQSSNQSNTIVTGNGFTKKAQRCVRLNSNGNLTVHQSELPLIIGRNYTLLLKYRSNLALKFLCYDAINVSNGVQYTIGTNTGNTISSSITFTADKVNFVIGVVGSLAQVGDWFEISEVLIIDNSNTQFYYNVFGPNGLNRSVSDYILLLKSGGNTASNLWIKSGAATRFCQDGSITNSTTTMPAYTRGANLGIFTITSIDGWDKYSRIDIAQTYNSVNSFYGNFPNILLLKTGGSKLQYNINYCRCKANFNNQGFANKVYNFGIAQYTFPGGINLNISELIGGSYNSVYLGFSNGGNLWGYYGGDVTPFSTEFATASQVLITTSLNLYGSMRNWRLDAITGNLYINNTNISEGTSTWNKTISPTYFSNAAFSTVAVDAQLKVINDYFAVNTPVKNIGITLNGATMGIPTGGANNTDLLGIVAKFVAAGFTATITVRTS